jgi:hypothetical protein
MAIKDMQDIQKAKIFFHTLKGIISDLMFYLDKGTDLSED